MSNLHALWFRLRTLLCRGTLDRELQDELAFHREMLERDFTHSGLDAARATAAARRRLGAPLSVRERSGDAWGFPALDDLWRDVRYGIRLLTRAPGFAAVAICTIALAIGINTGFFTLVDTLAWRPIPVARPEGLVRIALRYPRRGTSILASYPEVATITQHSRTLSDVIPYAPTVIALRPGPARRVEALPAAIVAGTYFDALGGHAAVGRLLAPDDDRAGAAPAVVISDGLWQRAFDRSPAVVGATAVVNGTPATIVGVVRNDFVGFVPVIPDFWITFHAAAAAGAAPGSLDDRTNRYIELKGRLRPGVTIPQARAEVSGLVAEPPLPAGAPGEARRIAGVEVKPNNSLMPLDANSAVLLAPAIALVALVLITACANLANLLLARAAVRWREIAIRLSLGASRRRVIRQLLVESAVIAVTGCTLGMVLSGWIVTGVGRWYFEDIPQAFGTVVLSLTPSWRVAAYGFALAGLSVLTFGLAPALQATSPDLTAALKGGDATFGMRLRRSTFPDALVVIQVCACVVLLAASATLVGTMHAFTEANSGLSAQHVWVAEYGMAGAGHVTGRLDAARATLAARAAALPGVSAVARALVPPYQSWPEVMASDAEPSAPAHAVLSNRVTPAYFDVVGQRLVDGRAFSPQDSANASPVVVLTVAAARRLWPAGRAVGREVRIATSPDSLPRLFRVIGVAADAHSADLWDFDDNGYAYFPAPPADLAQQRMPLLVRTDRAVPGLPASVDALAAQLGPDYPITVASLTSLFETELIPYRYAAVVTASIGAFGLLLAIIGLYGIVSFGVAQRRREIAVHLAVGATAGDVLRLVTQRELRLVLVGLGAGLVLAMGEFRLMDSLLVRMATLGAAGMALLLGLLLVVAAAAALIPARTALRVSPMQVLRQE